jgi:hypothetical protein
MELSKRKLKCILTNEEKLQISETMSETIINKAGTEDDLAAFLSSAKSTKAQHESTIKHCDSIINECAQQLSGGFVFRDVECETVKDYEDQKIRVYRVDTGEIVETRNMTEEEKQMHIDELINDEIEQTFNGLTLIGVVVTMETVVAWSHEERVDALMWAGAVYRSSEDATVVVPERPAFIPMAASAEGASVTETVTRPVAETINPENINNESTDSLEDADI